MRLYHFCCDHSARHIDMDGELRPLIPWSQLDRILVQADLPATGLHDAPTVSWLTDLPEPAAMDVGLTSDSLQCNRLENRYEVEVDAMRWRDFAILYGASRAWCAVLESDGQPDHWFVATKPIPVAAPSSFPSHPLPESPQ